MLPLLAKALNVSVETLLQINTNEPKKAHRGPASRIEKLLSQVNELPRRKQQKIADVLEALIVQDAL